MRRDRGEYLGLQRKVNPSGDEYVYFGCGDDVPVFDIGDLRFGITICYDSAFPELGRKRQSFPDLTHGACRLADPETSRHFFTQAQVFVLYTSLTVFLCLGQ